MLIPSSSVQTCKTILQDFILFAGSSAFGLYKWYFPGVFQPFQACMIILTYLYERPLTTSCSADHELLDDVFNIFRCFSYNVSQGQQYENTCITKSKKIWRVLENFRNKVYARAGWPIHDDSFKLLGDVSLSGSMVISGFEEDSIAKEFSANPAKSAEQSPLYSTNDALFLEPKAIPTDFPDYDFSIDMPVGSYFRPASRDQRANALSMQEDSPVDVTSNYNLMTLPYNTLNADSMPLSPRRISNTGPTAKQSKPNIETKPIRDLQLHHMRKSEAPCAIEDEFDFEH